MRTTITAFQKRKTKKGRQLVRSLLHKNSADGDHGKEEESDNGKKKKDENIFKLFFLFLVMVFFATRNNPLVFPEELLIDEYLLQ